MPSETRPSKVGRWSEAALRVLRERYLAREQGQVRETPEEMCWRVALAIASAEGRFGRSPAAVGEVAAAFYDMMVEGYFLPNSPTLMNAGKENALQYSACYVLPVGDSMEEIFESVKSAAIIQQSGGGTGFAFSRLRPKDDVVHSTGGRASGPVSFLRVFNAATEAVKQGGARRGANMGILRVDHPDILEFVECKLGGGINNFNISVAATDAFMEALAADREYDLINPRTGQVTGRLRAREVWDRIVRAAWRTGDPGMIFLDRINRSPANPTPELGLIEATNPCITGDALVATDRGLLGMGDIAARFPAGGVAVKVDQRLLPSRLMVWEGTNDVPLTAYGGGCLPISRAFCSGERDTVTVRTAAGFELTCTPDHRLMTDRGWVEAGALRVDVDRVWLQSDPGAFGTDSTLPVTAPSQFIGGNGRRYRHALPQRWSADLGRVLGWLVGDGWLRAGPASNPLVGFVFGRDDDAALEHIAGVMTPWFGRPVKVWTRARGVRHLMFPGKFFAGFFESLGVRPVGARDKTVPDSVFRAPRPAVVGFLQGLFSADGTVRENPKTNSSWIALTSKSRELLRGVQLLLLNLGIKSTVMDRSRAPRAGLFPYRTKAGDLRSYGSDGVLFELGIFGRSRGVFLREVGFLNAKQERLEPVRYAGSYAQKWSDPVAAVEPAGRRTVYDLTEPQSHSMISNGFVVHQCGEQPLLPNDACNLGSVNVAKFAVERAGRWEIDWSELERVVRLAVRFLDDVIEVNPYPLPQVDEMVKANRRVGLGIMGWADLLFTLGIPYDSEEALDLAERLMGFVKDKGHDQSARLADERGPFPHWSRSIYRHGRPLRNATVTTIAPTGTISMIAGCSSGIEPVFALAFEHRVKGADGERVLAFFSETFERLARRHGFHSDALMAEVARRGSLAGVERVPAAAREVFKTAHEIDATWHVRHQAAFQKHTDNGVSKTINLPESATEADVAAAYRQAWELGCLGITVFRDGSKGGQVLNVGLRPEGAAADAAPRGVKPRPHSLTGATYRMETPIGTAFITVNDNGGGEPFEVFVQVGKAGSDTMAVAEALGRLVSLVLRLPSPLSPRQRLEAAISQLSFIGGGQPTGFGAAKVLSLPDALARILAEHIGTSRAAVPAPATAPRRVGDLCRECGQATLVYEEGCKKCLSCGFNEC
ncbi:MAG TPA: ribonucleotide reductase N-terminal alpha domain-containing protein [Methylomirabilota bacterium]|nr:ribonucleotide reductase N-terminal alpha domain-containing protein [Methylomirabilota bacterium]